MQTPNVDYTYAGNFITFAVAPAADNQIQIRKVGVARMTTGTISNTDFLPEGSTNLYFTPGRQMGARMGTQYFTGDGITVNYVVGGGYDADNLIVFNNGVGQAPNVDYTYAGITLTFITPPELGADIQVRKISVISLNTSTISSSDDVVEGITNRYYSLARESATRLSWQIINTATTMVSNGAYFVEDRKSVV